METNKATAESNQDYFEYQSGAYLSSRVGTKLHVVSSFIIKDEDKTKYKVRKEERYKESEVPRIFLYSTAVLSPTEWQFICNLINAGRLGDATVLFDLHVEQFWLNKV